MTNETRFYTFEVDGAYRPVALFDSDSVLQRGVATAKFTARVRRFVIVSAAGVEFHGNWTDERAARRSCATYPRLPDASPRVKEVAPYWYAPAFGKVEAV